MKIDKAGFLVSAILSLFMAYLFPIYALAYMGLAVKSMGQEMILTSGQLQRMWMLMGVFFFCCMLYYQRRFWLEKHESSQ